MARRCAAVVYVVVAVVLLAAAPTWGATVGVSVKDDAFSASSVTVQQGDTVTWTWTGTSTHNVTSISPAGVLDSGNKKAPTSPYSHTFTEAPGTYTYECTRHSGMTGTVKVLGADTTPPPAPTASPGAGVYNSTQTVSLADTESGATIRYTTDGSAPNGFSTQYSLPITVDRSMTIKAIAIDAAGNQSPAASFAYSIDTTAPAAPTGSPSPGTYATAQDVTLSAESGATIRYTTDGSAPSASSTRYSAPVHVGATTTIKAIAIDAAGNQSPVATLGYTINNGVPAAPTASPPAGTYRTAPSVALTGPSQSTVRYTTDGSTPTASSTQYTAPITVDHTLTIKAISINNAGTPSPVASFSYVVDTTAPPAPTASPAPGAYAGAQTVELSDAESGATVRYTTDGSTPTASSPAYTGPISVAQTTTINAVAYDAVGNASPGAAFRYVIDSVAPPAPSASPPGGRYDAPQDVTLADADGGATIHYTTDGSPAGPGSPVASGPIHLDGRTTLNAVAIDAAGNASDPATFEYVISQPPPPAARVVTVGGYQFAPSTIIVNKGETVTWSWVGPDFNHSVTSDPGQAESFDSHPGVADYAVDAPPGGTFSHRFETVGSFTYNCRLHPDMRGTVTVVESGAPADQPAEAPTADASTSVPATAAAPERGARNWFVDVADMKFDPSALTVEQGDSVTWRWSGADTNHTVTSNPGQADAFESHPGVSLAHVTKGPPGGTFSHTFTTLGTFSYFCRLHPDMKGTITVVPRGTEIAAAPLRLSGMKLRLQGRRLLLTVASSATGRMQVQAWARARGARRAKRVRTVAVRARRGSNRITVALPASAVRRGTRLRAVVLGADAKGNSARPVAATITAGRARG